MCLQTTRVLPYQKWRWAGDEIVPEPIIPAARPIPGSSARGYDIDVREYLGIEDNAVIRQHVRKLLDELTPEDRATCTSRSAGSFDFRAQCVLHYVSRLRYRPGKRRLDPWLYPEETLARSGGDCEDLAFCLAALLEASGISSYCLRVVFGTITHHRPNADASVKDHVWVVYLTEGGAWQILEPMSLVGSDEPAEKAAPPPSEATEGAFEYRPIFTFNRHHLWRVRSNDRRAAKGLTEYLNDRSFWDAFDPSYGTAVHNSLFDAALRGMDRAHLQRVKWLSLSIDAMVTSYDPRDHFDFGYIDEGWKKVDQRLKSRSFTQFAYALHSIGDFYAHSNYAEFARRRPGTGAIIPYDPGVAQGSQLVQVPSYDFYKFAPIPHCHEPPAKAAQRWHGRIISGQWWRDYTTYPDELEGAEELRLHTALPDHDAFAVDGAVKPKGHRLYDEMEYQLHFADRRAAAVEHIRAVYLAWREGGPR